MIAITMMGIALANSSGSPTVKTLVMMSDVPLCSTVSSQIASSASTMREIAMTASSSKNDVLAGRTTTEISSSQANAKYAARIQTASVNVDSPGLS